MMRFEITHRFDDEQFADVLSAIRGVKGTLLIKVLVELIKEIQKMGYDLSGLKDVLAALRQDVQNVAARIDALNVPDPAVQAEIDGIAADLRAVDGAFDSIAPDPAPAETPVDMPDPAPVDPNA